MSNKKFNTLLLVLFTSLLFWVPLCSYSITLLNDSQYPLFARVYSAPGDLLTEVKLAPQQMYIWQYELSPYVKQNDRPFTPFTIRWVCQNTRPYDYSPPPEKGSKKKRQEYQSEFGVWENVPTGATVNALGSPTGVKTCVVRKETKKPRPTPPKGHAPGGFNNWSNDGGQTWSNDAGPAWDEGRVETEDENAD